MNHSISAIPRVHLRRGCIVWRFLYETIYFTSQLPIGNWFILPNLSTSGFKKDFQVLLFPFQASPLDSFLNRSVTSDKSLTTIDGVCNGSYLCTRDMFRCLSTKLTRKGAYTLSLTWQVTLCSELHFRQRDEGLKGLACSGQTGRKGKQEWD